MGWSTCSFSNFVRRHMKIEPISWNSVSNNCTWKRIYYLILIRNVLLFFILLFYINILYRLYFQNIFWFVFLFVIWFFVLCCLFLLNSFSFLFIIVRMIKFLINIFICDNKQYLNIFITYFLQNIFNNFNLMLKRHF